MGFFLGSPPYLSCWRSSFRVSKCPASSRWSIGASSMIGSHDGIRPFFFQAVLFPVLDFIPSRSTTVDVSEAVNDSSHNTFGAMHYLKGITAANFRHRSVIIQCVLLERMSPWCLCSLKWKRLMLINAPDKVILVYCNYCLSDLFHISV